MSAAPMGMPGWPLLAFCTASAASMRMVLTAFSARAVLGIGDKASSGGGSGGGAKGAARSRTGGGRSSVAGRAAARALEWAGMPPIRVAAVVDVTEAEGPGARFAVWVQGCAIRCPGCCNPHMFDPEAGTPVDAGELLARLDRVRDRVEGVTLLGGEPFAQATALDPFARGARERGL